MIVEEVSSTKKKIIHPVCFYTHRDLKIIGVSL